MTKHKKTTTTDTTTTELVTTTTQEPVSQIPVDVVASVDKVLDPPPVVTGTSKAYQLDATDIRGLSKNLIIIIIGYAVTYFSLHVMTVDVNATTMAIAPIVAGAIDAAWRYFKNNHK